MIMKDDFSRVVVKTLGGSGEPSNAGKTSSFHSNVEISDALNIMAPAGVIRRIQSIIRR